MPGIQVPVEAASTVALRDFSHHASRCTQCADLRTYGLCQRGLRYASVVTTAIYDEAEHRARKLGNMEWQQLSVKVPSVPGCEAAHVLLSTINRRLQQAGAPQGTSYDENFHVPPRRVYSDPRTATTDLQATAAPQVYYVPATSRPRQAVYVQKTAPKTVRGPATQVWSAPPRGGETLYYR